MICGFINAINACILFYKFILYIMENKQDRASEIIRYGFVLKSQHLLDIPLVRVHNISLCLSTQFAANK